MSSTKYPPPPTPPSILVARQLRMEAEAAHVVNERFVIRWDRIVGGIALGLLVGLTLVVGVLIGDARATSIGAGDRVCVAMLNADGTVVPEAYYCGPLVLTTHDSITGEDRP